jgi:hypothetical protein
VAAFSASDAARLAIGNPVSVQIDGSSTAFTGSVVALADNSTGSGRQAQIEVAWADQAPALGSTVQVELTVGHRDGVLLIPQRAIRGAVDHRSVDILDGSERRTVDIKIGAVSGDEAEVLSGVSTGQLVILPAT